MPLTRTIILGLDLDAALPQFDSSLGVSQAGPDAFLRFLETQLGAEPALEPAKRILRAEEALELCDAPHRFYHVSFRTSSLSTAARVLELRDELMLCGVDLSKAPEQSRLADFRDLEVTGLFSGGLADRIRFVMRQLPEADFSRLSIDLADPLHEFPGLLGSLCCELETRGAKMKAMEFKPQASDGTALAHLQAGLAGENTKSKASQDASLIVLRTATDADAAEIASRMIRADKVVVYDPTGSGLLLSEAISANSKGNPGFGLSSTARPALQILPAALALIWHPFDPEAAILFLSLPFSPIGPSARRQMLRRLYDEAGVQNEEWRALVKKVVEEAQESGQQLQDFIELLLERPTFPAAGAPVSEIRNLVSHIQVWAKKQMHIDNAVAPCAFTCSAFLDLLAREEGSVSRLRVEQLLSLALRPVSSEGVSEKGAPVFFARAGALVQPAETLVLWNFTEDAVTRPPVEFWSESEREFAAAQACSLGKSSRILASQSRRLSRMISRARQIIACVPETVRSVPAAPHPWLERFLLVYKDSAPLRRRTHLENLHGIKLQQVQSAQPVPSGPWKIKSPIPRAPDLSHSRLGMLFYSTADYAWRAAAVSECPFASLRTRSLLDRGTALHSLLERALLRKQPGQWKETEFKAWAAAELQLVLEAKAAHFLQPAFRELQRDLSVRADNLWILIRELARLKGTVDSEVELKGIAGGQSFKGFADIIVNRERPLILDLKPGGLGNRIGQIRDGKSLQLHIYAQLLKKGNCDIGYFLAGGAELLTTCSDLKGIHVNEPAGAHDSLMKALTQAIHKRLAELERGVVAASIDKYRYAEMIAEGEWSELLEFDGYAASDEYAGFRGEKQ